MGTILEPINWLVSLILVGWHRVFGALLGAESGWAWTLSIIGLTVVVKAALFPLFVKQIKASRNMQLLQPQVKELQKKYGHDRERLAQEQMKLFKETGTNPLASCLPILVQMPFFFSLYRVLNAAAHGHKKGVISTQLAEQFSHAKIFGVAISQSFSQAHGAVPVLILTGFLIVAMTITSYTTQHQLMTKNMPPEAMDGPVAKQMKIMMYAMPLMFAVSALFFPFPIGLLIYWTISNLWTMGQQFYVIRSNPAPNTAAYRAKEARDAEKARKRGVVVPTADGSAPASAIEDVEAKPAPRQQPQKQTRSQRQKKKKK